MAPIFDKKYILCNTTIDSFILPVGAFASLLTNYVMKYAKRLTTMAIIKCKECNGNVSTTAETCPHCGADVYVQRLTLLGWLFKVVLLFVCFACAGLVIVFLGRALLGTL